MHYPDSTKASEILLLLESIFPLAKCKYNLRKPLFYYDLKQCLGLTKTRKIL
jgi:excinuclease UvrABC nuclease subunit